MVKTSSLIGKKYPWTIVPTPCGHFLKGLTEVESPTWACQPSLAGYSLKAIKGNKKNPTEWPPLCFLTVLWAASLPFPAGCYGLNPLKSYLTLVLLFCSLDMLPNTSDSLLHVIFFIYNLLSPDSVAYVCTLVPVLQHICRGLRTTLESLFSPPTRDPTNKTQVVQLPWQGLLPMEASLHPRRCSIFILSLASIVLKIERKLF